MSRPAPDAAERAEALAERALRLVCVEVPYLAGLAHRSSVHATPRVRTACVFATGRIAVNPRWFGALTLEEAAFVMAHELMHLLLRTHERAVGADAARFNVAHDAVINDILSHQLGRPVPAGGVALEGARAMTPEELLRRTRTGSRPHWSGEVVEDGQIAVEADDGYRPDVLDKDHERRLFGDLDDDERLGREKSIQQGAWEGISVSLMDKAYDGDLLRRAFPDWKAHRVDAVHRAARWMRPPRWEAALQRWIEGQAPGNRSFARPSRRGGGRSDVVLAGREHAGWKLHVLLDTSTSMLSHFDELLGATLLFCRAAAVDTVRVVQAGSGTVDDDRDVIPEELERFRVVGSGDAEIRVQPRPCPNCGARHGSRVKDALLTDLGPALDHFARDPKVRGVLAMTDGYVTLPARPPPFEVLWVVAGSNECFDPAWGSVVRLVQDRV